MLKITLVDLFTLLDFNNTKFKTKYQQGVCVIGMRHRHERGGEGGELRGDTEHMQGVRTERGRVRQQ